MSLVWLRNDLRVAENPALEAAIKRGDSVISVYIGAPEDEEAWSLGAAPRW